MSNEIVNMDQIYDFKLTGPKYKGPQIKKKKPQNRYPYSIKKL